jgi:DNA transposase THAP9
VTKSQSKTGFLGLIICISSFKLLFERLVETQILKYILQYKFSQDHIELFFGVIRNHGCCNNNPNARQFMDIYKKTLLHLNLSLKFTGNSIPLEEIPILNCLSVINKTTPGFRNSTDSNYYCTAAGDNKTEKENCMVFSNMLDASLQLADTLEQIECYIAGFVPRKLQSKINCPEC